MKVNDRVNYMGETWVVRTVFPAGSYIGNPETVVELCKLFPGGVSISKLGPKIPVSKLDSEASK